MAQPVTTSVGAAPPPDAHGSFPPFATETFPSQLLWLALTFGFLYLMLSRVSLPRIGGILEDRSVRIARDLDEAQRLRTASEAAAEAYERELHGARERAKAIAQETRDALAAETEARRKALEAELAERLAASEATIRSRTQEAMGHVREIAAETTSAIVERLTGQAPPRNAVETALDRTLAR